MTKFGKIKHIILIVVIIYSSPCAIAKSCHGRFVNPITDVCWSCVLPISVGSVFGGKSAGLLPKKRDTKNPKLPLCLCAKGQVPTPGITLGFWEPVRMVDVTRVPYCMVGLGGLALGPAKSHQKSSYHRSYGKKHSHGSFYHVHYYIYPLIYWLELLTDLICIEKASFDVAYLSEFDPTWKDSKLQTLLNPEAFLFGNPAAKAACAIDCAAATIDMPRDELFWCAGCWGSLYPFSGWNADHIGGVQSSSLYSARIIAKMHRIGLAKETSTNESLFPGLGDKICNKSTALVIKKSQYKLQMAYPSVTNKIGCFPLGLSSSMYLAFKEYPYDGEDWSYIVWRKKNCCAF